MATRKAKKKTTTRKRVREAASELAPEFPAPGTREAIDYAGPDKFNEAGERIDPYLGESQEESARHNRAPAPAAAPSLDDVIGATVSPAAPQDAATALDSLAAALAPEPERSSAVSDSGAIAGAPVKRGRGRPRKDGLPAGSRPVAIVERDGSTSRPRETKEQLAMRVTELETQNRALAAQSDTERLSRLAESIKFLTITCFAPLAMWRGPHWEMGESEAESIAEPTAHALAPYAEQIETAMPWAAPVVAIATSVARRVMVDVQIKREAEARAGARVES